MPWDAIARVIISYDSIGLSELVGSFRMLQKVKKVQRRGVCAICMFLVRDMKSGAVRLGIPGMTSGFKSCPRGDSLDVLGFHKAPRALRVGIP